MMDEIIQKIIEIVTRNMGNEQFSTLESNSKLSELGMSSMAFIQMVVEIEETFDIEIPDEKVMISQMGTLDQIIDVVREGLKLKEH